MFLCSLPTSATPREAQTMARILPPPGLNPSISGLHSVSMQSHMRFIISSKNMNKKSTRKGPQLILCCSQSTASSSSSSPAMAVSNSPNSVAPPVLKKRKRYRRLYPGENEGITEEMRFVAMRLRNIKGKKFNPENKSDSDNENDNALEVEKQNKKKGPDTSLSDNEGDGDGETWKPSMEGFLKYLVDSKLVFETVERIVDQSENVAFTYFRKSGLERAKSLSEDLEWFSQQDLVIPEPSNPGVSYVKYLEELAETSSPLFLSHFYNIYFSHIAGGQVIARQVSEKLLEGRELEFYRWEGDAPELLKGVREKLNMLGEHWSRNERNKCLKEATKSFRFLGQIVRLIIL